MTTIDTIDNLGGTVLNQLSDDLASAVERAGAWTVTVNARRRMPATGIVWSDNGLIVTANHVVEQNEDITIGLPDGRTVPAKLLGRDPGSDIALLKIEVSGLTVPPRGDNPVRAGNLALAIGRPGPSGPMASFGVVSVVGGSWRTQRGDSVEGYVRADVAMLPGFSGGPLVDPTGNLIGLNSSTLGRGGGLTVPAAAIDGVVAALQTHGKVRRGFLGIGAQAVAIPRGLASAAGVSQETGLVVVNVDAGSPADKDGIFLGDVIVAVNETPVASVEELMDHLVGDLVGQPVRILVIRGGQRQDVTVTVGERA
ncbi:MAG: S1C family serine protease [Thermomicrobiales bacterium]